MAAKSNGNEQQSGERAELFRRLRRLKEACGRNKHDQATVLIDALIDEGIDTQPRIVGAMRRLDFLDSHTVLILAEGRISKRWERDAEGRYRHGPAQAEQSDVG